MKETNPTIDMADPAAVNGKRGRLGAHSILHSLF
jgi:hypothetical protein